MRLNYTLFVILLRYFPVVLIYFYCNYVYVCHVYINRPIHSQFRYEIKLRCASLQNYNKMSTAGLFLYAQ